MKYGYARVSTLNQANTGNSLEAQERDLIEAGAEKIVKEAFTGTKVDRPKLKELIDVLEEGDSLIVTKIDRLGRSVGRVSQLITDLIDKGVVINILNLGVLSNDSTSTLMRNVLLSFAQFERDMIVERTQEGKAIAKANNPNFHEGRKPKFDKQHKDLATELLFSGKHTIPEIQHLTGMSKSTLMRLKRERKFHVE